MAEVRKRGRQKGQAGKQGQAPIPTRDQAVQIIDSCTGTRHELRDKALLTAFFTMGLRPKEAASLKLEDVYDFERDRLFDTVILKRGYTKRGIIRKIPIGSAMQQTHLLGYIRARKEKGVRFREGQALFLSQKGDHFTSSSLTRIMNTIIEKRCGIRGGTGYCGRRFFGTTMYQAGEGMKTIQELMGHKHLSTTAIYTVSSDEQKREAVSKLL